MSIEELLELLRRLAEEGRSLAPTDRGFAHDIEDNSNDVGFAHYTEDNSNDVGFAHYPEDNSNDVGFNSHPGGGGVSPPPAVGTQIGGAAVGGSTGGGTAGGGKPTGAPGAGLAQGGADPVGPDGLRPSALAAPPPPDPNASTQQKPETWLQRQRRRLLEGDRIIDRFIGEGLARASMGKDGNYGSVGQPGFWESMIPFWGPLRSAFDHAQRGEWHWVVVDGIFLALDATLIGGLLAKLGTKVGLAGARAAGTAGLKAVGEQGGKTVADGAAKPCTPNAGALRRFGEWLEGRVCFAPDTPLLTPDGQKPICQFKSGDKILSAPENDPNGPIDIQFVEEVFESACELLNLHVGGRIIRTTPLHPLYVRGKGWTAAAELKIGDRLRSHDGTWVPVEGVGPSGEESLVYNLRVSNHHTYFVGAVNWGFSVWAHNACVSPEWAVRRWLKDQDKIRQVVEAMKASGSSKERIAIWVSEAMDRANQRLVSKLPSRSLPQWLPPWKPGYLGSL